MECSRAGGDVAGAPGNNGMKRLSLAFALSATLTLSNYSLARPFNDPRAERNDALDQAAGSDPRDPACQASTLVSTGGAAPRNPHTLAVRWIGYSNFELAYNGQVVLLDAYYDRGSAYPSLGFKAADVKKADAILVGHGHFDHMSDAAS